MKSDNQNNFPAQTPETSTSFPSNSNVDFNSREIKDQLENVRKEIKAVMENAHIDAEKLSAHFSI